MKALPLHQPWATLIALEAKRIETRHWPAPEWLVGQTIAIYASKTLKVRICREDPFNQYIADPKALPTSALVATVRLWKCQEITPEFADKLDGTLPHEAAFGNYNTMFERRWAWHLTDVHRFANPIPWTWPFKSPAKFFDVPDEVQPPAAPASHVPLSLFDLETA